MLPRLTLCLLADGAASALLCITFAGLAVILLRR